MSSFYSLQKTWMSFLFSIDISSIQSKVLREQRTGNLANNHVYTLDAPLPSREIVMTSSQNKIQVTDIIFRHIVDMLAANHFKNRFVVTCSGTTPTHLKSSHEESDVNIVKQCMSSAMEKNRCVKVNHLYLWKHLQATDRWLTSIKQPRGTMKLFFGLTLFQVAIACYRCLLLENRRL